jgi:hypothetical protein
MKQPMKPQSGNPVPGVTARRAIGALVTAAGVATAGITQASDWQPDRLRLGVMVAGLAMGLVGLLIWNPEPTAHERYLEAQRSTWPAWRQAVAPAGAAAFVLQIALRMLGADRHHLVDAQIATVSVLVLCLGIGVASYVRRFVTAARQSDSGP